MNEGSRATYGDSNESGRGGRELGACTAVPLRTCVGCRRAVPVLELAALTFEGGEVRCVPRGRRKGRGAWVHPREGCVEKAARTHAFARAFRTVVPRAGGAEVASLVKQVQIAFDPSTAGMGRNS